MPRVLALIPDLLFGSRVQATLLAAGYEVELVSEPGSLEGRLEDVSVLVVDLTDEQLEGPTLVERLAENGSLQATRTLGFYAHVDAHVRERAEQAGFDRVVPRSRMAREGAELVTQLVS
jgi:CheY-like chemotaxis protein